MLTPVKNPTTETTFFHMQWARLMACVHIALQYVTKTHSYPAEYKYRNAILHHYKNGRYWGKVNHRLGWLLIKHKNF